MNTEGIAYSDKYEDAVPSGNHSNGSVGTQFGGSL